MPGNCEFLNTSICVESQENSSCIKIWTLIMRPDPTPHRIGSTNCNRNHPYPKSKENGAFGIGNSSNPRTSADPHASVDPSCDCVVRKCWVVVPGLHRPGLLEKMLSLAAPLNLAGPGSCAQPVTSHNPGSGWGRASGKEVSAGPR